MASYYELLDVPVDASHEEIRRAYHRQARRHHPDAHSGSGTEIVEEAHRRMEAINAAWAVLGDPARRRAYDAEIGLRPMPSPAARPDAKRATPFPEWFEPDETPAAHLEEDPVDRSRPKTPADVFVFLPVGLVALAVGLFALSMVLQSPGLYAGSLVLVPVALVAFVATPLVTMFGRSKRHPPG
ncbi:MAG TPA: J domain-containing protein [Acidimicrobiales bacterium]|nr:J domain-containing protein [Acidimicrobiales bacterium]